MRNFLRKFEIPIGQDKNAKTRERYFNNNNNNNDFKGSIRIGRDKKTW